MNNPGSLDLKAYTLDELESYAGSPDYGSSGIIPVSPLRLHSYLHNPRAEKTDHVLFEMYHAGRLVAYRTLLPDEFFDRQDRAHRFAWFSGNYVDPGFRRMGISTRLFQLAEDHWEGRLMYTNYAPASRALYDRTDRFRVLAKRNGKRYYLRAASRELLSRKGIPGSLLHGADQLINQIHDKKLARFQSDPVHPFTVEVIDAPGRDLESLLAEKQAKSLFRRDRKVFEWILQYPWVTDQKHESIPYHFSYRASLFKNRLLMFSTPELPVAGFLWMVIHDKRLTVPYAISTGTETEHAMAVEIIRSMIHDDCAYTTLREHSLVSQMNRFRSWFLARRGMPQLIFVHDKIAGLVPADRIIYDGDGDVVFTG